MPKYIIEETVTYLYEADTPEKAESDFLADDNRQQRTVAVMEREVYPVEDRWPNWELIGKGR